jgi:hypothetical protein
MMGCCSVGAAKLGQGLGGRYISDWGKYYGKCGD